MPLSKVRRPTKANCRANVSKNIRKLKAEGRPLAQSVAIALSVAKKGGCKVGKKPGSRAGRAAGRAAGVRAYATTARNSPRMRRYLRVGDVVRESRGDLTEYKVVDVYEPGGPVVSVEQITAGKGDTKLGLRRLLIVEHAVFVRSSGGHAAGRASGRTGRVGHASGDAGQNLVKFMHVPATAAQYRHIVADALAEEHGLSELEIKKILSRKRALRWVDASFRASKYPSLMAHELVALEKDGRGHSTGSRPPVPRELQRAWMSRGIDVQRAVDRARQVTEVRKRPETAAERRSAIIFFTQAARDFRAAGDEATAQLFLKAAEAERGGIDARNMELLAMPVSRDQSAWARELNREERAQIAHARAGHGRASGKSPKRGSTKKGG